MGKLLKYGTKRITRIALCEEHFEESCFGKSGDLRRRLINSKDEFKFNFIFVL